MTKITFFKRDGVFFGFRESGHSGFGEHGNDILCSALSAMTMLIINTIELSYSSNVDYTIDEDTTTIIVKCISALPESDSDERVQYAIAGLFSAYYYQISDLMEEYYDFIELNEEEC